MIAMAIQNDPRLLIADEPTTALDPIIQKELLLLLKGMQSKLGFSLLFVTHDLGIAKNLSDRVIVLKNGEIVEVGPPEKIFNDTAQEYTRELVQTVKDLSLIIEKEGDISDDENVTLFKNPLLSVDSIDKSYQTYSFWGWKKQLVDAVKDVSFTLNEGEVLGLIGESGSGKSTIGKLLTGLIQGEKGEIKFGWEEDEKIHRDWHQTRAKVQMILQNPYGSFLPNREIIHSFHEAIGAHFPEKSKDETDTVIRNACGDAALDTELLNRLPLQLSGGEIQRAAIAKSLVLEPRIIICDEVVSALDVSTQGQIIRLLKQIVKDKEIGMIFISHDLGVVQQIADRIIVIRNGYIVEAGTTKEIFSQPKEQYTKELIESVATFRTF